ncbi:alpha/beta hydrolase family protein [Candidatus Uabimicrobium amorphum]|uniref:Putative esterase YitV n=1 Tax=Uabimicrobium amorphum TaxID=2596890 RepID=A0A5S9IV03_UABAM|nr:alpha/beta fold hydrolase [Candidatus Uabimicrobium amorphum]BBM88096.1 putative esterase YitV [Candidatus Uabimicrobium amorphum]
MIHTQRQHLQNTPCVFLYKDEIKKAVRNGTILFFHGLGASKDVQLHDLENLAQHGFLVVGIDNVGHGERKYEDFDTRFSTKNTNLEQDFQQAVLETAQEVPILIEELQKRDLIHNAKVGVTGISMGGFITYRALVEYPKFKAAVSILGSPKWKGNNPYSPHLHHKCFFPTPLMSLNAGKDTSVPAHDARELHQHLREFYAKDKHRYIEYPESEHFMRESDWDDLWQNMVLWFQKWLMT